MLEEKIIGGGGVVAWADPASNDLKEVLTINVGQNKS